ncbi:MAG: hypothetical protein LBK08_05895 [Treponema sp.]|jgi:hypothetical protein|nr:hypothetical protein [Treponema sp.]
MKDSLTVGEAQGRALDTLRLFFEENMSKKGLPEALKNLVALWGTVTALAGEEAE